MPVAYVTGDLCTFTCDIALHQGNATSRHAAGLAATLFARFPEANVYKSPRSLGQLLVCVVDRRAEPNGPKAIGCCVAQQYPGRANTTDDTPIRRLAALQESLTALQLHYKGRRRVQVSVPFQFGCGLARGDWTQYLACFTRLAQQQPTWTITIVQPMTEKLK